MKTQLSVLALLILIPLAVAAQESRPTLENPVLVVSGTGEVNGVPDMAEINVGVVAEAESAKDAIDANNQQMKKIISTLKEFEIADKDIQTSNFNVSPRHNQVRNRDDESPKIIGYHVSNQVHVRHHKLDSLGEMLDKVVSSGANQINSIRFSIDQSESLLDEARNKAIHEAKRKAQLMAEAAGVKLGKILEIRENDAGHQPVPYRSMAMAKESSSVPIETGEQTLTTRVLITFSISKQ